MRMPGHHRHPSCFCHDNSYATGHVLTVTKIPRFSLKQGLSTPNNLIGIVKTTWEPYSKEDTVPL